MLSRYENKGKNFSRAHFILACFVTNFHVFIYIYNFFSALKKFIFDLLCLLCAKEYLDKVY